MYNQQSMKSKIRSMIQALKSIEDDSEAEDKLVEEWEKIFSDFKDMLEVQSGIPVSTSGTAAAQSGATTQNGTII